MVTTDLKHQIQEDMKAAMRAREQKRLSTIRLIIDAIKRKELDDRKDLNEADILSVLDKMLKQRRESIAQYKAANRNELADQEAFEIQIIETYLPPALSEEEIDAVIKEAITNVGAATIKDMGKTMAIVKPKLQGRADMRIVGEKIKLFLS